MTDQTWILMAAGLALVGLMAYAVLGGADFGGGVWDLFSTGPRKNAQRQAIADAMGPVWEANHVWLIFVIVVLFTAFPYGYAPLGVALFVPFHLALVGIMMRGASFVFRGYVRKSDSATDPAAVWGVIFGIASVISPILLGAAFGVVTEGNLDISGGKLVSHQAMPWLGIYPLMCGLLALSTCAYLAAVYLSYETEGALREDFHKRAIVAGTSTAALAGLVLGVAWFQANEFVMRLVEWWPVLGLGMLMFGLSAWAVFSKEYLLARIFAAGEVIILLLGWGLAQQPYMVYPGLTLKDAAGPIATIQFLIYAVPVGFVVLIPSLWYMFKVFKTKGGVARAGRP